MYRDLLYGGNRLVR